MIKKDVRVSNLPEELEQARKTRDFFRFTSRLMAIGALASICAVLILEPPAERGQNPEFITTRNRLSEKFEAACRDTHPDNIYELRHCAKEKAERQATFEVYGGGSGVALLLTAFFACHAAALRAGQFMAEQNLAKLRNKVEP